MTRNSTPKSERISGVIIDARNIYHIPAMVPKIFNEEDKLVYGHAITQGQDQLIVVQWDILIA